MPLCIALQDGLLCLFKRMSILQQSSYNVYSFYISNNVKVGDGCIIQNNVSLYEGVVLENNVFCGASAVFTNDLTPRVEHPKGRENYKKTLLKTGASIGANATIVCGHTIGEWAMVAAGAVVIRDVLPYALVMGVPARQVGWVCKCGTKLVDGKCNECGKEYIFEAY